MIPLLNKDDITNLVNLSLYVICSIPKMTNKMVGGFAANLVTKSVLKKRARLVERFSASS